MNEAPLCSMPWTTACGNLAVVAYLDEVSGNILYRCHLHQLRLENGSAGFQETVKQMTVEEAIAHEVMNG
jgi:hypothetical protein